MTIKEAAEKYGVSKQAVYQRLKKKGCDVNALTDAKSGELTEEGVQIIAQLYSNTDQPNQSVKLIDIETVDRLTAAVKAAEDERDAMRQACEVLTAQAEQLREKVNELTGERDYLRRALEMEQMTAQKLIAAPAQQSGGRIARAWAALRGK